MALFTTAWAGAADPVDEVIISDNGSILQAAVKPAEMRRNPGDSSGLEEHNPGVIKSNSVLLLEDISGDDVNRYFLVRTDEIHPDAIEAILLAAEMGELPCHDCDSAPNYQLLTLSERESVIKGLRNRPPGPTLVHVAKNGSEIDAGVDLAETDSLQSGLSEKIEELTISNQAQEKQISRQEEVIAKLTARLEALEKSTRQSARRSLVAIVGHS
jgi:transcription elongation GreA/GreB family factor